MPTVDRQVEFARLLAASRGQLFGHIYSLVQNFHDTEELFQETALLLWEKFDEFEPDTNFTAWACTTSYYLFCNYLKRKHRGRLLFNEDIVRQLAETQANCTNERAEDRKEALAGCLERLGERDRHLVQYYEGKQTVKQIAQHEGRTPEALYMALSRIRRALFQCIQSRLAGEGGRS